MVEMSARSGRAAIITGGAGEIGRASARRLAADGVDVLLVDRDGAALERALPQVSVGSARVLGHVADVLQADQVDSAVSMAMEAFGRIDILANIAGGAGPVRARDIDAIDLDVWDHVIALNLRSTFLFTRAVVPIMRRAGYGRIVNLSSIIALGETGPLTTVTGRLPYATAKAALLGFTAQLAKDVAEHGITANALLPSLILGEPGTRIRDRFEGLDPAGKKLMQDTWPTGRAGRPDEVAAAVAFLASEAASYISGVALPVDGALS